jgi:glucose-1-phosphate cytidylyltransferase
LKTVILCGGLGSRISEETKKKPKPMVKIGKDPILVHIIKIYIKNGFTNFVLALGYKKNNIIKYFKNHKIKGAKIQFLDTGKKTLTGNRLLKLKNILNKEENFFLTYGDGLSNVNLKKLLSFHLEKKKVATITAVRPTARFGQLKIAKNNLVKKFEEKNQINEGWINGGFFVLNKKIFNYLPKYQSMLEREPMYRLTKDKQLISFKHYGFWQCMDTLRDKEMLNQIWKKNKHQW